MKRTIRILEIESTLTEGQLRALRLKVAHLVLAIDRQSVVILPDASKRGGK